mgnify:CR=1 FL=1
MKLGEHTSNQAEVDELEKNVSPLSLATIIYTSGTTGTPKGVMLTETNISSNVEAIQEVIHLNRDDSVLGVLPFFHSFGFTGTL